MSDTYRLVLSFMWIVIALVATLNGATDIGMGAIVCSVVWSASRKGH